MNGAPKIIRNETKYAANGHKKNFFVSVSI